MAFSSAVTISATLLEPLPFHFQDKVIVSIIEIEATRAYCIQRSLWLQSIFPFRARNWNREAAANFFIGTAVDKTPFLSDCCWKKNDLVLFLNVGPKTFCRKDELSKSFIWSNRQFVIFSVSAYNNLVVKADNWMIKIR